MKGDRQSGLTLIEVLVALAVFGAIAALSTGVIQAGVSARDTLDAHADALREMQLARAVLREDFAQLAVRPVRGAFGGRTPISFSGGMALDGEIVLRLVRHGWTNPGGTDPRSDLQAVEYRVEDGALIRAHRPLLDPVPDMPMRERVLLTDIRLTDLGFFAAGRWQPRWQAGPPPSAALPQAVSITLELRDYGPVQQLFLAAPR